MTYRHEVYPDKASRLAAQEGRLSASTIPTLLGYGYSASALELWGILTGRLERKPRSQRVERMLGLRGALEAEVARWAGEDKPPALEGLELVYPAGAPWGGQELVVVSEEQPYLSATPDGLLTRSGAPEGSLEVKTDGRRKPPQDRREGPSEYAVIQVHAVLAITGWDIAYVPTAWGLGDDLTLDVVPRNDELCRLIRRKAAEFWGFVESNTAPTDNWIDASHETRRAIEGVYPEVEDVEVEAPELWEDFLALELCVAGAKAAKETIAEVKNRMLWRAGNAGRLVIPGPDGERSIWRRKPVKKEGYTVQASTYMDFREVKK